MGTLSRRRGNGSQRGSRKWLPQATMLFIEDGKLIKPNPCLKKLIAWWGHSLWLTEYSLVLPSGEETTYPPFMRHLLGSGGHLAHLFKIFPELNSPTHLIVSPLTGCARLRSWQPPPVGDVNTGCRTGLEIQIWWNLYSFGTPTPTPLAAVDSEDRLACMEFTWEMVNVGRNQWECKGDSQSRVASEPVITMGTKTPTLPENSGKLHKACCQQPLKVRGWKAISQLPFVIG